MIHERKIFVLMVLAVISVALTVQQVMAEDTSTTKHPQKRWAVYYDDVLPPERFLPYDVVVFDSINYPRLRPLQNRGKTLLGYISFGEAEEYRYYFDNIKKQDLLLEENPNWPGHFIVDARNPLWAKYLVEVLVPDVLRRGFDGIMVDTLDSLVFLEMDHPDKYRGMAQAAADLIHAVRMHYPDMPIMINRGIEILPKIEQDINMLMAENIYTNHNFKTGEDYIYDEAEYLDNLNKIKASQKRAPHLEVYALEYWDPKDEEGVQKIIAKHKSTGFYPFVSVIGLDELHDVE